MIGIETPCRLALNCGKKYNTDKYNLIEKF